MEILSILQGLKNFERSQEARNEGGARRGSDKSGSAKSDSVKLSSTARLFSSTMREAVESPEARQQRVEKLKELVESGNYRPDSRKIAEKIVQYDLHLII
jgi:negative regulator of flagellin synthesis FlgM